MTTISENQTNLIDEKNDKERAPSFQKGALKRMTIFFTVFFVAILCCLIPGITLLSVAPKECRSRCTLGEAPCEIDQCHCVPRRTPEFCEDPEKIASAEGVSGFILMVHAGVFLFVFVVLIIFTVFLYCYFQPKEENSEENFKPNSLELKGDYGRFEDEEELPVADD